MPKRKPSCGVKSRNSSTATSAARGPAAWWRSPAASPVRESKLSGAQAEALPAPQEHLGAPAGEFGGDRVEAVGLETLEDEVVGRGPDRAAPRALALGPEGRIVAGDRRDDEVAPELPGIEQVPDHLLGPGLVGDPGEEREERRGRFVDREAAVPVAVEVEAGFLVPQPAVDQGLRPVVLFAIAIDVEGAAEDAGDLGEAPGVQGVERAQVQAVHRQRPGLRAVRGVVPVRQVLLARFPAGPHLARGVPFPGRQVLAHERGVRTPFEQAVAVPVAAGPAVRARRRPEIVPALQRGVGPPQDLQVAQALEELQDDIGAERRLRAVGRPARPAPPARDVPVRILGLEDRRERVESQLLALERELEHAEEGAVGQDGPILPASVGTGVDRGPSGRRVEPMASRLVEDRPVETVGDGLRDARSRGRGP